MGNRKAAAHSVSGPYLKKFPAVWSLRTATTAATRNLVSTEGGIRFNVRAAMGSDSQLTPMMAQYRRIKGELPKDALLLFRLGDFYELFFEDAQTGAQILNLALTARNGVP